MGLKKMYFRKNETYEQTMARARKHTRELPTAALLEERKHYNPEFKRYSAKVLRSRGVRLSNLKNIKLNKLGQKKQFKFPFSGARL